MTGVRRCTTTSEDLIEEFPNVFDGQIESRPGEKFKIQLVGDAKPFCVTTTRPVPIALMKKLKEELDLCVALDLALCLALVRD